METTRQRRQCPFSGLWVLTDTQWMNIEKGNYQYNYTKIGDSIVYVCNSGIFKNFNLKLHETLIREFIKDTQIKLPYVEIRDFKNLSGRIGPKQISQTKDYILRNQADLAGFVYCNMPYWVKKLTRMGFKSYGVSTQFAACKTYGEAVLRSVDILENKHQETKYKAEGHLTFDQLEFNPKWTYTNPKTGAWSKIGIIPQKILYTQIHADTLDDTDAKGFIPLMEQVFKNKLIQGDYIRIADYTGVKTSTLRARRTYGKALNRLRKVYDSCPKQTYVCGAGLVVRSSIKMFSSFVNQKAVFVDSVSDAFEAINSQNQAGTAHQRNIRVSQKDIDEINELCGMMIWPEEEIIEGVGVSISPDNPLVELSETLRVVQEDLAGLRRSQGQQILKIMEARKEAEAANRTKSEFLANMSHEIRTPMNGVMGMLDILKDTPMDAAQKELIETASQSADSLLGVVNDILDFSKIESGKMTIETIEFDLYELLDSINDVLCIKAFKKNIEFGSIISSQVPQFIQSDPGRLRQVLTNLIKNAITFVSKGGVLIRVSLENQLEDTISLVFEVLDTGIGIPREKLETLFDAFTQVDTSTTRLYGGTGLGLAISKQLVEIMGGEIGVDSRVNKGSRFWFTLTAKKSKMHSDLESSHTLGNLNILLVTPSANTLKILTAYFSDWGCHYVVNHDADLTEELAAKARADNAPFDLILADINPRAEKMSHWIESLNQNPALKNTRLALLSPVMDLNHAERKLNDIWISKPLKKQKLFHYLKGVAGESTPIEPPDNQFPAHGDAKQDPYKRAAQRAAQRAISILLAEDNIVNQKVILNMLSSDHYQVTPAEDGAQALDAFKNGTFDLILMDIQMPVMGGLDATREIRRLEKNSNTRIPIIALTANAMKGDREICLDAGMDEYLPKPVKKQTLIEIVDRICGR